MHKPMRLTLVLTMALSSLVLASCGSSSPTPTTAPSTTTTLASSAVTVPPSSKTLAQVVNYLKSSKVCQGKFTELAGKTLTPAEVKVHVTGAVSCETKSTLTLVDYFAKHDDLVKLVNEKGFITAVGCRLHNYDCAVTEAGQWLFVGLISTKYKSLIPADEVIMKADQAIMDPALVNARA